MAKEDIDSPYPHNEPVLKSTVFIHDSELTNSIKANGLYRTLERQRKCSDLITISPHVVDILQNITHGVSSLMSSLNILLATYTANGDNLSLFYLDGLALSVSLFDPPPSGDIITDTLIDCYMTSCDKVWLEHEWGPDTNPALLKILCYITNQVGEHYNLITPHQVTRDGMHWVITQPDDTQWLVSLNGYTHSTDVMDAVKRLKALTCEV